MNTPIEHPGHLENIPAEIAVRKAQPTSEFPFKAKPRMPREAGGPKLGWRPFWFDWPFRAPFEGDLAIKALRQRLALDPDLVPRPPMPSPKKAFAPLLGRLGLMAVVAGMGVYGLTPFTPPRPLLKADSGAPRVADASPGIAPSVRLVIGGRHAFANEPLTLGISLNGATGGEFALLNGLLAGTRLSVGRAFGSTGWRVAARDLTAAIAYAPQDFVGVMNAAIDVRTPSDILLDRNVMRL